MSASIRDPHFLLRKVHSLLGIIPIGGFLAFHMYENSMSRHGMEHYNTYVVEKIQGMNYVRLLEIFVIALPILFHALYGLVIWWSGKSNVTKYGYFRNWMYWTQRITGFGVLGFLIFHVGFTRILAIWDEGVATNMYAHMQELLGNPAWFAFYVVGLALSALHFGNGLWTFGISWGVTTTEKAQKLSFAACMGITVLIVALGIHSLVGFFLENPSIVLR